MLTGKCANKNLQLSTVRKNIFWNQAKNIIKRDDSENLPIWPTHRWMPYPLLAGFKDEFHI